MKVAGAECGQGTDWNEQEIPGEVGRLLKPGVLVLATGDVAFADARALELLGWAAGDGMAGDWRELCPRLVAAGLDWQKASRAEIEAGAVADSGRQRSLAFELRPDGRGGGVLLVSDPAVEDALTAELHRAALLRSLSTITPAVAHDLRAPINAMVFNLEILKETIAAGPGVEPAGRDRQLRYVNVLREELTRLHRGMEVFIGQVSPRGDHDETLDLREPVGELAELLMGPARKQQVKVEPALPANPVPVEGNRFLLRQALLHLAVAALGTAPRDGALEVRLEPDGNRARITIGARRGGLEGAGPVEAPASGLRLAPGGVEAQIWSARTILARQGGQVRALGAAGNPQTYEVELSLAQILEKE